MQCHRCLQSSPLKCAPPLHGTKLKRASVTSRRRLKTAAAKVAVGIDLGTTSSAIALINEEGKPFILQDDAGKAMVPSVVTFTQLGEVLVGHAAQQAVADEGGKNGVDPSAHFYSIKRLMGCKYSAIQDLASKLSYPVVEGPDGMAAIAAPHPSAKQGTEANHLMPQDISAHVLRHLLLRAEATLAAHMAPSSMSYSSSSSSSSASSASSSTSSREIGSMNANSSLRAVSIRQGEHFPPLKHIHEAVITVPAYFTPAQRAATIEAGKTAGLKRVSLLQEPVAAAMAYGYGTSQLKQNDPAAADKYDTLLVFDLGGGTFDVSVLEGFEGILEVLSTDGDAELGGDDFTRALAGLALHKARLQSGSSGSSNSDSGSNKGDSSSRSEPVGDPDRAGSSSSSSGESTQSLEAHNGGHKESSSGSGRSSGIGIGGSASTSASTSTSTDEDICTVSRSLLSTLTPAERLAVLTAAEEAKQNLGGGSSGHQSASIQLPCGSASSGTQGNSGQEASVQTSISSEEAGQVWAPLMARLWRPLYRLATDTRTQFGGRLPASASLSSPSSSKESTDTSQNNSSNKGSWEFHMFPPSSPSGNSTGGSQKYVAPPRRLTGVVLVGGSTRMPCIRDFIEEITGMGAASGVNPEEVVALGAALQAGVLVGSVGAGAELADGSYISGMHGRTTGIIDAGVEAAPWQP